MLAALLDWIQYFKVLNSSHRSRMLCDCVANVTTRSILIHFQQFVLPNQSFV
ncbi:UNC-50 family protein [Zea mays]|uniref:UNC-50 family protein n=1 Tax=Zea mays TaxID=4577 RepID=A0A1D6HZW3_MAIZE|nr:UNC-50 family protein [Zea mays]